MAFKVADAVDKPMNKVVALIMRAILCLRGVKEVKTKKGAELVSKHWVAPY